jgi:serine/threonine protein phosphatase 1
MQTYAIGDIHGHIDALRAAHDRIAADRARFGVDAPVVHVGDLVDRGPDCRGVVHYLMEGQAAGAPWVVLKGNHDRLFTQFLNDPFWKDPGLSREDLHWFDPRLGGAATLASYGVAARLGDDVRAVRDDAVRKVPANHRQYLEGLPLYLPRGEALFVHAGIRPGVPMERQTEDDLVWIRKGFLEVAEPFGPLVVHGHTAIEAATHFGNRVDIDSGVAYGGPLSAVLVDGRRVWLITDQGRVELTPQRPR